MQKIMFNDRYHHTNAVIEERKTRATQIMAGIDFPVNMVMGRVLPDKDGKIYAVANGENIIVKLRYKVGEVVAVAQCYNDVVREFTDLAFVPGSTNKMFVRADLMPHQIRITGIKCEQWFIAEEAKAWVNQGLYAPIGSFEKCLLEHRVGIPARKATVEEIIEHFKKREK
jgi:hypothetical protein